MPYHIEGEATRKKSVPVYTHTSKYPPMGLEKWLSSKERLCSCRGPGSMPSIHRVMAHNLPEPQSQGFNRQACGAHTCTLVKDSPTSNKPKTFKISSHTLNQVEEVIKTLCSRNINTDDVLCNPVCSHNSVKLLRLTH